MSYNGWSNYETWRINLELCDGLPADFFSENIGELPNAIKEYCVEYFERKIYGLTNFSSETRDVLTLAIVNCFLQQVNWREIASHMMADEESEAA